jgi:hypothetical protein
LKSSYAVDGSLCGLNQGAGAHFRLEDGRRLLWTRYILFAPFDRPVFRKLDRLPQWAPRLQRLALTGGRRCASVLAQNAGANSLKLSVVLGQLWRFAIKRKKFWLLQLTIVCHVNSTNGLYKRLELAPFITLF